MMQPIGTHIAELNYGRLLAPADNPVVAEFINSVSRVNAIAERTPGFIWRLPEEDGSLDANQVDPRDPLLSVNMSVWETARDLEHFVFGTLHRVFYERGAEWFERPMAQEFVMWWVAAGHLPEVGEGLERLAYRKVHGESGHAFGWRYLIDAGLWRSRSCTQASR